jgi:septal ring factor EnvC (AmiA/AmiB activator)
VTAEHHPSDDRPPGIRRHPFLPAAETLRLLTPSDAPPLRKEDEKISMFWRIFGGSILSIGAMLGVTVYQQMNNTISDLRAAVTHVQESQADVVKKDDLTGKCTTMWTALTTQSSQAAEARTRQVQLEDQLRASQVAQKELLDKLERLSERMAKLEGEHSVLPPFSGNKPQH